MAVLTSTCNDNRSSLSIFCRVVGEHLQVSAERRKVQYDRMAKGVNYEVGTWVWHHCPNWFPQKSEHWQKCYGGPYLIVRKITPVTERGRGQPCSLFMRTRSSNALTRLPSVGWKNLHPSQHHSPPNECLQVPTSQRDHTSEELIVGQGPPVVSHCRPCVAVANDRVTSDRPRRGNRRAPVYLRDYEL